MLFSTLFSTYTLAITTLHRVQFQYSVNWTLGTLKNSILKRIHGNFEKHFPDQIGGVHANFTQNSVNVIETLKFYLYRLIVYHYIICILYCENKKYFESTKYFKTFGLYINFNELQTNFTCHGLLKENWSRTKLWWLAHRRTSRKENKVVNWMKEVHRCTPQTPKDTIQRHSSLFSEQNQSRYVAIYIKDSPNAMSLFILWR